MYGIPQARKDETGGWEERFENAPPIDYDYIVHDV